MKDAVRAMRARGVATLLSEQNLAFVDGLADRAVLIEQGQLVGDERGTALAANPAVRRVLGVG